MISRILHIAIILIMGTMNLITTAHAVTRIANPAEPSNGVESVKLVELWRAGGEDDELFFGNVVQVIGDEAGHTFVLDVQMEKTFLFSPTGQLLRELGGHGEGPGETNNINSIFLLGENQVAQGQVLPGKVVTVDRQGDPGEFFSVTDPDAPGSGFVLLLNGTANANQLLLVGMRWGMDDTGQLIQNMFLRRYDHDGTPRNSYYTKSSSFDATHFVFDELKFDFIWNRFGLTNSGAICHAPRRNVYEIEICSPDGTLQKIYQRDYQSVLRNDNDKLQARLTHEGIGSRYGRELQGVTIEETEPDIVALWPMPNGEILVRTSRGDRNRPTGVLTTLDVFDDQGRFIKQRQLICPGDPLRDGIHVMPDGKVVVVIGAADAGRREVGSTTAESIDGLELELAVICYEAR